MREDLKQRRKLSYLMNVWDDVNLPYILNYDNIEQEVIDFFFTESQIIYPAKSYFVAIVYAHCLSKYFHQDFLNALSDSELLPDDKFFIPYSQDKERYDKILQAIGNIWQYPSICKTVNYFQKEFLIDEENLRDSNIPL